MLSKYGESLALIKQQFAWIKNQTINLAFLSAILASAQSHATPLPDWLVAAWFWDRSGSTPIPSQNLGSAHQDNQPLLEVVVCFKKILIGFFNMIQLHYFLNSVLFLRRAASSVVLVCQLV